MQPTVAVSEFDGVLVPDVTADTCFTVHVYIPYPYGRLSKGHREFSDYCLESTAQGLATKFPGHAVWVVLPKTHVHGALASYDNFGKTDWASGGAVLECECGKCVSGRLRVVEVFCAFSGRRGVCLTVVFHAQDVQVPNWAVFVRGRASNVNRLRTVFTYR